ncbi:hypothetical protein ABMC88_09940 [Sulfitobacter sp. HNIBRBA2951]|uniref:hypothetical protein n=1 Tax=Sulfitobacter aquimarinus TaxID=3158557 RepID=UPI0032E01A28
MKSLSSIWAALLLWTAGQAVADQQILCSFKTECIETESCAETGYDITITHKPFAVAQDGMDASASWSDDAATRTVFVRQRPDILFAMWAENDGRQFGRLMADATGDARYVVMDVSIPMMLSYYGTCKGTN